MSRKLHLGSIDRQFPAIADEFRALTEERERLRDALEAYCARCPNCRGKGQKLRQQVTGHFSEPLCHLCGWAWVALGKA